MAGGKLSVFEHKDAYLFENAVTRVKLGQYDGDTLVAIKSTVLPEDEAAKRKAFREKDVLKRLRHAHIVRCVCVRPFGLVVPLTEGSGLIRVVRSLSCGSPPPS